MRNSADKKNEESLSHEPVDCFILQILIGLQAKLSLVELATA